VAPTAEPTAAPNALTQSQKNAIESARSYLQFSGFSRLGLIDQLVFEKFTVDDATFAVDSLGANWNEEAAESAASYLAFTSFSCQGLIDQLVFEKFTVEEAAYGASTTGLCG
jgi:Host cell surface-exposed lipoprotein